MLDSFNQKYYREEKRKLLSFILDYKNFSIFRFLRAQLFENHAQNMLSQGGNVKMRQLLESDTSNVKILEIPNFHVYVFKEEQQIQERAFNYFRLKGTMNQ